MAFLIGEVLTRRPAWSWIRRQAISLLPWLWAVWLGGLGMLCIDRLRAWHADGRFPKLALASTTALWSTQVLAQMAALLLGVVAALLARGIARLRTESTWLTPPRIAAAIVALGLAVPLQLLGTALVGGAWISEQWYAPIIELAPVGAGVVVTLLIAPVAFGGPDSKWLGWLPAGLTTAMLIVGSIVAELADHLVFPGLYPEFHLAAYGMATLLALVAGRRVLTIVERKRGVWLTRLALIPVLSVLGAPILWATMSASTRAALVVDSSQARDLIRELEPERESSLLSSEISSLNVRVGSFDPGGALAEWPRGLIKTDNDWNVLLVVVDTLRSDAIPPRRPPQGKKFSVAEDTPFINEWLEGTFRFRNAYAASTMTHKSMPTMFRSIEVFEDPTTAGLPLGLRMEKLGRTPLAVVVPYFVQAKYARARELMEGFGEATVYEKNEANDIVPEVAKLIERHREQPFFAWVHYYNMHDPGFDGKPLRRIDGSRVKRYQRSLRWLDGQLAKLMETLEKLGVADKTIVVLASDHGEGLGDNRQELHGPTIFEEETHVPLAISIPGHRGRIIEQTVGNIDIVPTIVDLLGGAAEPGDRGRSMVPLMVDPARSWDRGYYLENRNGKVVGIVRGRTKLIHDKKIDATYRFDLATDPTEDNSLFDPASETDRSLLRALMEFNPSIVRHEYDAVRKQIVAQLRRVDAAEPGAAFPFLIRIVGLDPGPHMLAQAERIFEEAEDDAVRLLLVRHLFKFDQRRWSKRLRQRLETFETTASEAAFIDALARQGQLDFAPDLVSERLESLSARGRPRDWLPWLRLIDAWEALHPQMFAAPLHKMLTRVADDPGTDLRVLELLLDSVASLRRHSNTEMTAPMGREVAKLLDHRDARIRAGAVRALTVLRHEGAVKIYERRLRGKEADLRVRRELLLGLAALAGRDAQPVLLDLGEDADLTAIVVRTLAKIGDTEAIPFLERMARAHYNTFVKRDARRAMKKIRKRERRAERRRQRGKQRERKGSDRKSPYEQPAESKGAKAPRPQ